MSRIADAFAGHSKTAALMPYLMGGHPDPATSRAAVLAAADAGADLIELGIPFSDPLADGPVIHAAATEALSKGVRPDDVLSICEEASSRLPIVLMVYANVVLQGGGDGFLRRAASAGAAGLIVPDLPHDEAGALREAADAAGIDLVPLAAPTTTEERMRAIGADARGFVYAVSLVGTTGERDSLPPGLEDLVGRVRASASVPVAVGFGISTSDQAARVATIADGVIVGSRIVRAAGEAGADGVREVVSDLAGALSA